METAPGMTSENSFPTPPVSEQELRDAMVQCLIDRGDLRTAPAVAAFQKIPRHLAAPGTDLGKAYDAESALITKTDATGVDISSVSAPRIQAIQIEQAGIQPGMNILEIGSGGVNAAYLAELVGDQGQVVTMDIDPDVTARARDFLQTTGHRNVVVITGDGVSGAANFAPFDRVLVTVQATDIPTPWVHQLKMDGRLVVPLRMRGMTRTVAFVRDDQRLNSDGFEVCGFVPLQGAGENRMRVVLIHDVQGEEIGLRLDGHPEPDTTALAKALAMPRCTEWSAVTLAGNESNEHLDLWLATALDNLPLMAAQPAARARGLVASASPLGIPTLVEGGSFAYRTVRRTDDPDRFELGAVGHGPRGQRVAERLVEEIRTWDRHHRGDRARISVYPAGTPDEQVIGARVIDRPQARITISWP